LLQFGLGMAAGGPQAVEAAAPDLATLAGNMKQAREAAYLQNPRVATSIMAMQPMQAASTAAGLIGAGRRSAFETILPNIMSQYNQLGLATTGQGIGAREKYFDLQSQAWRDLVNAQLGQRQQDIGQRGQDVQAAGFNAQVAARRAAQNQGFLGDILAPVATWASNKWGSNRVNPTASGSGSINPWAYPSADEAFG